MILEGSVVSQNEGREEKEGRLLRELRAGYIYLSMAVTALSLRNTRGRTLVFICHRSSKTGKKFTWGVGNVF